MDVSTHVEFVVGRFKIWVRVAVALFNTIRDRGCGENFASLQELDYQCSGAIQPVRVNRFLNYPALLDRANQSLGLENRFLQNLNSTTAPTSCRLNVGCTINLECSVGRTNFLKTDKEITVSLSLKLDVELWIE